MNKREKILAGIFGVLGLGLGCAVYSNVQKTKKIKQNRDKIEQLSSWLNEKDMELLQKRGNIHFIKNCISIIKCYAEGVSNSEDCDDALLAEETNKNTLKSIEVFGDILEYLTYTTQRNTVSLHKELKHLDDFIKFIKIRSESKYKIRLNSEIDNCSAQRYKIIVCLFSELVENAYKHSKPLANDNNIDIHLSIIEENYLSCIVSNPVYISKRNVEKNNSKSMGIKNLEERLDLFYGSNYKLESKVFNKRYEVRLIVKL
ncbi:MAG: histidine kinase [Marinifilaceae bacterium]|jgi:LytS/YehU family sensor histidine kinase|nr:histidine kinase [Marinifilaceae bacterium]